MSTYTVTSSPINPSYSPNQIVKKSTIYERISTVFMKVYEKLSNLFSRKSNSIPILKTRIEQLEKLSKSTADICINLMHENETLRKDFRENIGQMQIIDNFLKSNFEKYCEETIYAIPKASKNYSPY